jgi:hypothetical protein
MFFQNMMIAFRSIEKVLLRSQFSIQSTYIQNLLIVASFPVFYTIKGNRSGWLLNNEVYENIASMNLINKMD